MRASLRTEWKFRQHILDEVDSSLIQHYTYTDAHLIYKISTTTLKEEIMQVQNDMIERGLVYFIGARSMTRRVIEQLQNICENQSWHKFVAIQTCCNLLNRKKEREMISHHQNNGVDMSLQCAWHSEDLRGCGMDRAPSALRMPRFMEWIQVRVRERSKVISTG